jgi:hypothetical protein
LFEIVEIGRSVGEVNAVLIDIRGGLTRIPLGMVNPVRSWWMHSCARRQRRCVTYALAIDSAPRRFSA